MKNKTLNMTEGDCGKQIILFALPILIGNLFQQVYSLADTMIAARFLGTEAIAAIGATAILSSVMLSIAWGLNSGYCIILSRYFGSGNQKAFRQSVGTMVKLNLFIGSLLTVCSTLLLRSMMRAMHIPQEIFEESYRYISIVLAGMLTTIAYNGCSGYLRAIGNSRTPLIFLIFASLLNLALDVLFVVMLHTGIAGTALATVFSQGVSAVLCFLYIRKNYRNLLPEREDWKLEKEMTVEMLSTGLSMAMMQSVVSIGSVILQRAINELGTAVITAHTASRRVFELMMIPLSTIAISNSTFVSQNTGADKPERVRAGIKNMILCELLLALVSAAFVWIAGRPICVWLTASKDETIIGNALLNLRVLSAFLFPLGVLFVLRYAMQSLGHKVLPVLSSAIELTVKIISALWFIPALGYVGVTLTEPIIWCLCALFLTVAYLRRGKKK